MIMGSANHSGSNHGIRDSDYILWSQKQSLSSVWGKGIEKSYIILNQMANDKYGDWY